jgi:hypothetical protein
MNRWLSLLLGNLLVASSLSLTLDQVAAQDEPPQSDRDPRESVEELEREIGALRERMRDLIREQARRRPEMRRAEGEMPPELLTGERAEHVRQAVEHLMAAGLPDEARRLEQRILQPQGPRHFGTPPGQPYGPWGQAAAQQMGYLNEAIGRLSDAVQRLEQRTRDSDRVASAADEAHRRVEQLEQQLRGFADELKAQLSERFERLEHEQQRLRDSFEHQQGDAPTDRSGEGSGDE